MSKPIIVWFRQDLRREDNPALHAAYEQGVPVIPVYILDDVNSGDYKMGGASRWWLHQSLNKLNDSLSGHLSVFAGDAADIIPKIAKSTGAQAVYWNRCYEPWRTERDKTIKQTLKDDGFDVKSFNGSGSRGTRTKMMIHLTKFSHRFIKRAALPIMVSRPIPSARQSV